MKTQRFPSGSALLATGFGALCLAILAGCSSTPKAARWNLELRAQTDAAVRVDVVGFNSVDKRDWETVSVDDYWTNKSNALRASGDRLSYEIEGRTIKLLGSTPGGGGEGLSGVGTEKVVVPSTHKVWNDWKARNVIGLAVIGDFPGEAPTPDRRKVLIPLYKDAWEASGRTLSFEIQDRVVKHTTPPSLKQPRILGKNGW